MSRPAADRPAGRRESSGRPSAGVLAARWEERHPGFAAGDGLLHRWLRAVWWLARPLASAGITPDAVTLTGAALALAATRARPGTSSALVLGSALCDGLDGAVAVLRDVHTAHGAALDHAADRVGDLAAAAVLVHRGAPWAVVAPAAGLSLAQELLRGRWQPVLTVNERPTRMVCAVLGDLGVRITGRAWPALVSAAVWDALALVGAVQVLRVRRRSRGHRPD